MLNFSEIAKATRVAVPVLNRGFRYNKKAYSVNAEDGWWVVEIQSNRVVPVEQAFYPFDLPKGSIAQGYTHHNNLIFQNFDVAKRKWKLGQMAPINFNQAGGFEAIKVCVWEDRQVYFLEPNYNDVKTFELKDLLESGGSLDQQKGVTPELQTVFLFHALEQEQLRKLKEEADRKQAQEELLKSIPGRLAYTLQRAGAELLNYSISGTRIVFDWKSSGHDQRYNSVIDSRTWMVVEAGYCMSGDDRRHNITSLVKTADLYAENRRTHITRGRDDDWDRDQDEDW